MRIFFAGATGVIGRSTVPRLVAAGHEVFGMTRRASNRDRVRSCGAEPVVADALDPAQVAEAVARVRPEVVVHQLTAIGATNTRHMERDFAATNRLRTDGTDHLVAAARAAGVRRFVAQSHVMVYAMAGPPVKCEQDALEDAPVRPLRANVTALRHTEDAVLGATDMAGVVLRYGWFYGPGTSLAPGSAEFELIARRAFPVVGDGGGVWSFVHVSDAADATVAAVGRAARGAYNVVDDEPATVAAWLPEVARQLGARPPRRVPRPVGRLFAGEAGVAIMTRMRGASNEKARRELDWRPAHPSWRSAMVAS